MFGRGYQVPAPAVLPKPLPSNPQRKHEHLRPLPSDYCLASDAIRVYPAQRLFGSNEDVYAVHPHSSF